MDVEGNETSSSLVSVLSKIVNLSRKTPEQGEGLMLVTMWWERLEVGVDDNAMSEVIGL